jgi:hypothetical protein
MQMKTTMRYHFKPARRTLIEKEKIASVDEDVEKLEVPCHGNGNGKWFSHFGKQPSVNSQEVKPRVTI